MPLPTTRCRPHSDGPANRRAATIGGLAVALLALALFAPGLAQAQPNSAGMGGIGSGGVRTDERDVTVVLGGELVFDAVVQSQFFRQANDSHGWEFVSTRFRIDLDVRFTHDFGLYAALQTSRRDVIPDFGTAFPRSVGYILGEQDPGLDVVELFVDASRLLGIDWSLRGGLAHFALGLDTSYEDTSGYPVWDGHGRLVFDTANNRGRYHDRMRPVGIHASYAFGSNLHAVAYAAWMSRDLSDDSQDTWVAAVEGHWYETNLLEISGGYLHLFDRNGPDMEMIWASGRLQIDQFLLVYGEAAFQLGNEQSGTGWYGGVRYLFDQGRSFVDASIWVISGDDTATLTHQEGFQNFGSLNTLMIVESLDYGLGRQSNYSALKVVLGIPIRYDLRLRLHYGRYNAEDSSASPRPGDEANVFLTYHPSHLVQLEAGFGFLYTSRIYGPDAQSEGWMAIVRVRADF